MKTCYGISLAAICQLVSGGWTSATVVLGHLRQTIPPERASRLYIHWGGHSTGRENHPANVQLDRGRKCVVFRCLSNAKRCGYVESRGPAGGRREYHITKKGLDFIKENGNGNGQG